MIGSVLTVVGGKSSGTVDTKSHDEHQNADNSWQTPAKSEPQGHIVVVVMSSVLCPSRVSVVVSVVVSDVVSVVVYVNIAGTGTSLCSCRGTSFILFSSALI